MKDEKLVITEETQNNLANMIIDYAREKNLTLNNIKDVMEQVSIYMSNNALLKNE